jgi:hypothetical protein
MGSSRSSGCYDRSEQAGGNEDPIDFITQDTASPARPVQQGPGTRDMML